MPLICSSITLSTDLFVARQACTSASAATSRSHRSSAHCSPASVFARMHLPAGCSESGRAGGVQKLCAGAKAVQVQVVDTCGSCAPTQINVPFPVFNDNLTTAAAAAALGSVAVRFRQARLGTRCLLACLLACLLGVPLPAWAVRWKVYTLARVVASPGLILHCHQSACVALSGTQVYFMLYFLQCRL